MTIDFNLSTWNGEGNGNGNHSEEIISDKKHIKLKIEPISQETMKIEQFFSPKNASPFDFDIYGNPINWVSKDVKITDDSGKLIYTQQGVEKPELWSDLALKVVASKYFWGNIQKGERENSVKQLIGRVGEFIGRKALQLEYFDKSQSEILKNEIISICINQLGAFNSPVWFNAGIQKYSPIAGGVSPYRFDIGMNKVVRTEKNEDSPQCSACFILSVEDNMEAIMDLQKAEVMLFKGGSGAGSNRSNLRSSKERLTGGGWSSGPLSFMKGYDSYAGAIKSGGKTRRAAKMEILNVDHPDIIDFINAKQNEEKKAWALIEAGYSGGLNGEAYSSIYFQNSNMSIRVTDEFMESAKQGKPWQTRFVTSKEVAGTYNAREMLYKIAEGTWICGDPGIQCDTIINKYHTCKNSGRINASNPCVTGDTRVLTKDGRWKRIDSLIGKESLIITNTGIINESSINGSFETGTKPVYKLTTKSGYNLKLTADHKVFTINRGFVEAKELTRDDFILLPGQSVAEIKEPDEAKKNFYQMVGVYLGDGGAGKVSNNRGITLAMNKEKEAPVLQKFAERVALDYERITHKNTPATMQITNTSARYVITNNRLLNMFSEIVDLTKYSHEKCLSEEIFNLELGAQKYILQGLFTADGTVANYGEKSQYVSLDSTSLQLLKDTQLLLLGFGIKSKIYKNRRAGKDTALLPDGKGGFKEYKVKEVHSLRISKAGRVKFEKMIGFMPESYKSKKLNEINKEVGVYKELPIDSIESLDYLGMEKVYDLTEPMTHTFVANGITIHNCSEYMFLDDSSCNLASLNLMKFRTPDGGFDVERFKKAVRAFITSMEIIVDSASYPTEKITLNSHLFRPLGLGYANIGALLMSYGLPYDSEEGRAVAAAITAIMSGEAYKTSAELASLKGPFPMFEKNRESMLEVIELHRENVKSIDVEKIPSNLKELANVAWDCWSDALDLGEKYGFRNAQVTVLAPTGTIAFLMDCDTTGIEPDIALVKYKVLAGGGMLKLVNQSVKLALENLRYDEKQIKEIMEYIEENDTIEGAPHIIEEHNKIFDCAFKAAKGNRFISYKAHIDMMAVCQPFISGAISKTINMPENSSVKEIAEAYMYAWESGLKAVAIYRENSKRSQPLNTKKTENEIVKRDIQPPAQAERKKLPQTHKSITHKFEIAGHEGYITVGLYDDGKPGEIFITMHKQGSTIRGLMDAWATSVSVNLQYGAPVDILFSKFRHQKFEPSGFVKNNGGGEIDSKIAQIKSASSIVDYVAQFMLNNFAPTANKPKVTVELINQEKDEEQVSLNKFGNEGLTCPHCGGPAKRIGNCAIYCTSCKQTTRSGCGE